MNMTNIIKLQLGKKGLTKEFLDSLKTQFKNVENIRISILKSCCRDREELKEIEEKIIRELGEKYTCKSLGYTLILKKWRKARITKKE